MLDRLIVVDVDISKPLLSPVVSRGRWSRGKCIQPAMTGISRGHSAVEKSIPHPRAFQYIGWVAYSQSVHGKRRWNKFPCIGDDIGQQFPLAIQGPSSVAKSIKSYFQQLSGTALAQLARSSTLYYSKQQRPLVPWQFLLLKHALKFLLASPGPLNRPVHRCLLDL